MNNEKKSDVTKVFTIGFTKKSAEEFFTILRKNKVKKIIDIRLNNDNQLAGFSKKADLKYFLKTILNIDYEHKTELAPTDEILQLVKKEKISWKEYEMKYIKLISSRRIENLLTPEELNETCLLCSEAEPEHCHRRLLAEYLSKKWNNVIIKHL